jgi:NADH:ubiquinone oxidoreductase subunit K
MIEPLTFGLFLGIFLFCTGLLIVIIKKNAIFVLMGIELMLNGANVNFVVFSQNDPEMGGQIMGIFVVVLAAAEAAIGLAILLNVFKFYRSSNLNKLNRLKY